MFHPMITAVIADDENHARERLKELLDKFPEINIVAEASDGTEALNLIIAHKPQVAFLDINMPGISVFAAIPSLQDRPFIVFQTAHFEYAADAYDIDALDYLLKPVRGERLAKTIAKIHEKLDLINAKSSPAANDSEAVSAQVTVKSGEKTNVIAVKDIVRISVEDGFSSIYTDREKLISDNYLSYYEKKLKGSRFFRTSRTDIVNLDHIAVIHKQFNGAYTIELKDGKNIELSRRKAQQLKKIVDF